MTLKFSYNDHLGEDHLVGVGLLLLQLHPLFLPELQLLQQLHPLAAAQLVLSGQHLQQLLLLGPQL